MAEQRAGQSFSETELKMLEMMIKSVPVNPNLKILAKNPAFPRLATKIREMREKLNGGGGGV